MTLTLAFRFVSGRYHATPYGHHVNEGLIEWPPSPWRLLRALISVGYTACFWNEERPFAVASSLVEALAQELPSYYLPEAIGTHSRHFMPKGIMDKGVEKTTLVFDTWARLGEQELFVNWPEVSLSKEEESVLRDLLANINYLGRSESWVEARMVPPDEETPAFNCVPDANGRSSHSRQEQVVLLSPSAAPEYLVWRGRQLENILSKPELQPPNGRKPTKALEKKRQRAQEPYPLDLIDCLQKDTTWLRKYGWNQPPGSQRTMYLRPANAISVGTPIAKPRGRPTPVPAILLSLTNASNNDHALPSVTRSLPQGELLHRALVGIATRKRNEERLPIELIGRDENAQPLQGPHEHAHIHPLDLDEDGHIDHILIWAAMGLSGNAQSAIRAARTTYTKGGLEPMRLAMAANGSFDDLAGLPGRYGARLAQVLGPATKWRSLTPFVASRHLKRRGKNTLKGQVVSELEFRGLPHPISVNVQSLKSAAPYQQFRHFVLSRQSGPQPPRPVGFAVELEFSEPIAGPIALGYASHFGLGIFLSETD